MPVLRLLPADPTDLVLQGEQLRVAAMSLAVAWPVAMVPVVRGDQSGVPAFSLPVVEGQQTFGAMVGGEEVPTVEVLRSPFDGTMVAANAGIATPCGAWIPTRGAGVLINPFVQSSERFAFVGTTRDNTGAALGACRVVAFETGRMTNDNVQAEVGETVSDGSGAYTLPVALNTAHQLTAYKAGSPDVAGISANTVTPTAIG